jgi:hypothetical protein
MDGWDSGTPIIISHKALLTLNQYPAFMRKTFILLATLLALYSCNNGNYNSNPNTTGNTPNNNVNCPLQINDTTCSCTDTFSWYLNGQLYTAETWAGHADQMPNSLVVESMDFDGRSVTLTMVNYTGPGTYNVSPPNVVFIYVDDFLNTYSTASSCTGGVITVSEDNNGIVKGKFYAVMKNPVNGEYVAIKGGRFISRRMN